MIERAGFRKEEIGNLKLETGSWKLGTSALLNPVRRNGGD
jgi:hypothetical protein